MVWEGGLAEPTAELEPAGQGLVVVDPELAVACEVGAQGQRTGDVEIVGRDIEGQPDRRITADLQVDRAADHGPSRGQIARPEGHRCGVELFHNRPKPCHPPRRHRERRLDSRLTNRSQHRRRLEVEDPRCFLDRGDLERRHGQGGPGGGRNFLDPHTELQPGCVRGHVELADQTRRAKQGRTIWRIQTGQPEHRIELQPAAGETQGPDRHAAEFVQLGRELDDAVTFGGEHGDATGGDFEPGRLGHHLRSIGGRPHRAGSRVYDDLDADQSQGLETTPGHLADSTVGDDLGDADYLQAGRVRPPNFDITEPDRIQAVDVQQAHETSAPRRSASAAWTIRRGWSRSEPEADRDRSSRYHNDGRKTFHFWHGGIDHRRIVSVATHGDGFILHPLSGGRADGCRPSHESCHNRGGAGTERLP